jgi:hypothetical protein
MNPANEPAPTVHRTAGTGQPAARAALKYVVRESGSGIWGWRRIANIKDWLAEQDEFEL